MLAQEPDGGLLVGGEAGGSDPAGDPEAVAQALVAAAAALLGLPGLALAGWRIGRRPVPRDGFPAVGPLPGDPRVHVAVTHSGVTLAPAVAALLAAEVLGGPPSPLLAPFRPARFVPSAP